MLIIPEMREILIEKAREIISCDDPSHDINHPLRVLKTAEYIVKYEGGDLEVIIPAALLHDAVNHPKNDPRSRYSADESAIVARDILKQFPNYDPTKIIKVEEAIVEHSYTNGIKPKSLESKIIQDADRLEATGVISIMRTFSSAGQMKREFYNPKDPFCEQREPGNYAIDLFYKRLLKVGDQMNTKTAKRLAEKRTEFLYSFLEQLKDEI
jgi:uncharacterized protein|tara:strand:+ start:942 stop:1574 length:633 start_codon:yes stop_codon:yes gene_type:complete